MMASSSSNPYDTSSIMTTPLSVSTVAPLSRRRFNELRAKSAAAVAATPETQGSSETQTSREAPGSSETKRASEVQGSLDAQGSLEDTQDVERKHRRRRHQHRRSRSRRHDGHGRRDRDHHEHRRHRDDTTDTNDRHDRRHRDDTSARHAEHDRHDRRRRDYISSSSSDDTSTDNESSEDDTQNRRRRAREEKQEFVETTEVEDLEDDDDDDDEPVDLDDDDVFVSEDNSDDDVDPRTVDPLESSAMEDIAITQMAAISKRAKTVVYSEYLRKGYSAYLDWLVNVLEAQGVSESFVRKATFCVVRDICNYHKIMSLLTPPTSARSTETQGPMCPELIVRAYVYQLMLPENQNAAIVASVASSKYVTHGDPPITELNNTIANEVYTRICNDYDLDADRLKGAAQVAVIQSVQAIVKNYLTNVVRVIKERRAASDVNWCMHLLRSWHDQLIQLSPEDYARYLSKLPSKVLSEHSSTVWRGTMALIKVPKRGNEMEPLAIDIEMVTNGNPYAPMPGFHIGIRMLQRDEGIIEPYTRTPDSKFYKSRKTYFTFRKTKVPAGLL